jgi:uncharacterized protein YndB with AHSA1/START domain
MAEPYTFSVRIEAAPDHVFRYFTEPASMVRWMGDYAVLDAKPGGEFTVDVQGVPVRGRYLELEPPHRLLISWGHAGSDALPPGASTVEVLLRVVDGGTEVQIIHSGLPEAEAAKHARGWPYFLGRLVIQSGQWPT